MDARASTLYDCAVHGDIAVFRRLVEQDESVLERLTKENVLHVAASFGHARFVAAVLSYRPELSSESNEEGLTPLHVAASGGAVETCRVILQADPDAALSKDNGGRFPAHLAATRGKLVALQEILGVHPWCVKYRTDKGESILHLSVKYNRLEVVTFLLGLEEVREMVNDGDGNGNTVLHLAAARKQGEMLNALLSSGLPVDRSEINGVGINAYELFCKRWRPSANDEIVDRLRPIPPQPPEQLNLSVEASSEHQFPASAAAARAQPWMKKSDNVMLVAVLIATVTFQAGLAPPGGLWQDTGSDIAAAGISYRVAPASALVGSHAAGTAILAPGPYDKFMAFDTGAFVFSLMALLFHLVMKTSTVSRKAVVVGWAITMMLALVFFALAFYHGIAATQPKGSHASKNYQNHVAGWFGGCAVGYVITFLVTKIVLHYWM